MYFLHKLLLAALAPFIFNSLAQAHEASHPVYRATRGLPILLRSGETVETYHPPTTFETYGSGIDHPQSKRAAFNLQSAAVAYATSQLPPSNGNAVAYVTGFSGDVTQNAFLVQTHDGVPYSNAVANVVFNKNNQVVSYSSSYASPDYIYQPVPSVLSSVAFTAAAAQLNATYNNSPVTVEYYAMPDNSAEPVYVFEVANSTTGAWYLAFVSARTGIFVSAINYVSQAAYTALPFQEEVPTQGFQTIVNPADLVASPLGWHNSGSVNTTTTSGNNAIAFKGTNSSTTTQSSAPLIFSYNQDPTLAPTAQVNVDAARVNTFYIANSLHDLFYRYGFTENSFNFQNTDRGLGGSQGDAISISVQDAFSVNTADFASPPDGTAGRLRTTIWTSTTPNRDGALENDLVIHEITHGLTSRLTGGGTARCLKTVESLGLSEGWSDAMANWAAKTSSATPDFVLGQYVTDNPAGIRSHPYSTNLTTNPLLYSDLQTRVEPHASGEIWANMLYQVYAGLVAAHGWSATARTNPTGTAGNIVWLHLFVDALALQPCSPTFVNARDAIVQADVNRNAGANSCTIWNAFASRGLGVNATNYVNDFSVPSGC